MGRIDVTATEDLLHVKSARIIHWFPPKQDKEDRELLVETTRWLVSKGATPLLAERIAMTLLVSANPKELPI